MSAAGGPWFSASQVETYELCPRKWAWKKIAGLEDGPSGPSAELGIQVHAVLEAWLRNGTPINTMTRAGQIVMSGLHLLPAPQTPGMRIEEEFRIEIGGHRFVGYKDVEFLQRVPPLVEDHKTTKDFRWAKTADDLRENVQACLYAVDAMHRAGANECDLQWTYFRTTKEGAHPVRLRVTREQITPRLERICRSADEMTLLLASGCRAQDVTPNASACEAFGGCEYQQLCNLTPEERIRAIMTQQQAHNDLLARLQNRNGINPPPVAAASPPAPAAPGGAHWNGQCYVDPATGQPIQVAPPPVAQYAAPPAPVAAPPPPPAQYAAPPPPPPAQVAPPPPPPPPAPEQAAAPATRRRRAPAAAALAAPPAPPQQVAQAPTPVAAYAPPPVVQATQASGSPDVVHDVRMATLLNQAASMLDAVNAAIAQCSQMIRTAASMVGEPA